MNRGYILLHRQIQEHWIWASDEKFDDRSAWIDLLLTVNHEEKKIPYNKSFIIVHRGQHLTSQVKLAARWHWTRDRVKRYLNRLKKDGMIEVDCTGNNTLITIVNYDNFQSVRPTNQATHKAPNQAPDNATHKAQTNNYINNYTNNEERKEMAAPAPPSDGGEWQ